MIVQDAQLGGLDGAWETWCDQKYPGDAAMIAKCKAQPLGFLSSPPWTDVGALERGLPKDSIINTIFAPPSPAPPPVVNPGPLYPTGTANVASLFGVPKTVLIAGAVILAVGVGAVVMSKRRRSRRR